MRLKARVPFVDNEASAGTCPLRLARRPGEVRIEMKAFARICAVAVVITVVIVAVAVAASPIAPVVGGTYRGASAHPYKIKLVVGQARRTKAGTEYRLTVTYCGHVGATWALPPTARTSFYYFSERVRVATIGVPVTLYRLDGKFTSRTKAQGRIDLNFSSSCDGQPVDWSATLR